MNDEKILEILSKQTDALTALTERIEKGAIANVQTAPPLHGNGGLFSNAVERDVVTAHVRPYGIATVLPIFPSTVEDPRFATITGFTDVNGVEPTAPCDDAPSGFLKGANLTARFAMTRRDSQTIDVGKLMLTKNRGDFTDLVMRGRLLGLSGLTPSSMNEADFLNLVIKSEMVGTAIQAERKLSMDMWRGTIAGGSFPGLDVQVATGQKDADTGVLAPALDSDLKDFNYDLVGGTARDIVEYVSMLEFYIRHNAETMGLMPVEWIFVMNPGLWEELSAVWPLKYNTQKANSNVIVNGMDLARARDEMRNSMQITVNGNTYRVVKDSGIYEDNNITKAQLKAGEYASSIYFLPMSIVGNMPVLYREYIDFSTAISTAESALNNAVSTFWTDAGVYSWALDVKKWCLKLNLRTEQRVILRTPHLAGKIQRVKYSPLQHLRTPYANDPYFADGGVSTRGSSWGQAVWS